MDAAAKSVSQLVVDSNALFKQFSLSVRVPDTPPDFLLNTLVHDLRQCLYLIRSTPGFSTDEGLLLSTQAWAYHQELSSLVTAERAGLDDEVAGTVLQVIRDFCDLIQRELGPRAHPLPGRCLATND